MTYPKAWTGSVPLCSLMLSWLEILHMKGQLRDKLSEMRKKSWKEASDVVISYQYSCQESGISFGTFVRNHLELEPSFNTKKPNTELYKYFGVDGGGGVA